MISATLQIDPMELERQTGWAIKPEGACKDDSCVPLNWSTPPGAPLDLRRFAERLGMPLVHDERRWPLVPRPGGGRPRAQQRQARRRSALPDLDGAPFDLASLRGRRCCWSPGPPGEAAALTCPCGRRCASELHPHGLEVVTVALDTGGAEAARPWIEAAQPQHPSLIDQAHLLDALFGIVNVPSGVWIDEQGMIVRPPEPAYPRRARLPGQPHAGRRHAAPSASRSASSGSCAMRPTRTSPRCAIGSRTARPAASRWRRTKSLRRSRPRPLEEATAAAHFELGATSAPRPASPPQRSSTSAPRTGSSPTTGPTSARPGTCCRPARPRTRSMEPTGCARCKRSAPSTTTRRWISNDRVLLAPEIRINGAHIGARERSQRGIVLDQRPLGRVVLE